MQAPADPVSALEALDPRRRLFVREYLVDFEASAAYFRAGYKAAEGASRNAAASRLLAEPGIQAAIAELVNSRERGLEATRENVIAELSIVAFSDLRDVLRWGPDGAELLHSRELSPLSARAVRSVKATRNELQVAASAAGGGAQGDGAGAGVAIDKVTVQVQMHDKLGALRTLAQHLGILAPQPAETPEKTDLAAVSTLTDAELIAKINQGIAAARAGKKS